MVSPQQQKKTKKWSIWSRSHWATVFLWWWWWLEIFGRFSFFACLFIIDHFIQSIFSPFQSIREVSLLTGWYYDLSFFFLFFFISVLLPKVLLELTTRCASVNKPTKNSKNPNKIKQNQTIRRRKIQLLFIRRVLRKNWSEEKCNIVMELRSFRTTIARVFPPHFFFFSPLNFSD